MIVNVDKLGRIVLKKKLRERYGEKFIIVDRKGEIVLKPLQKNMDDLAEKLEKYSLTKLKRMAEREAGKEALGNLR